MSFVAVTNHLQSLLQWQLLKRSENISPIHFLMFSNSSRYSSNYEKFFQIFTNSCLLIGRIDQSECSRVRYSIPIGQLTGNCEGTSLKFRGVDQRNS